MIAGLVAPLWMAMPELQAWYWLEVVAPREEARFGFHARLDDRWQLEVASVEPNGAFDQAGVRAGWEPWEPSCLRYQGETVFRKLHRARSGVVELRFITGDRTTTDWDIRRVTIAVPGDSP